MYDYMAMRLLQVPGALILPSYKCIKYSAYDWGVSTSFMRDNSHWNIDHNHNVPFVWELHYVLLPLQLNRD
jgi:hypothetical protein